MDYSMSHLSNNLVSQKLVSIKIKNKIINESKIINRISHKIIITERKKTKTKLKVTQNNNSKNA